MLYWVIAVPVHDLQLASELELAASVPVQFLLLTRRWIGFHDSFDTQSLPGGTDKDANHHVLCRLCSHSCRCIIHRYLSTWV